jgi:hypothetical protein
MKKITFNRNGSANQLAEKLCMKKGDLHILIGCSRSYVHHADTRKRSMGNKFSHRLQNLILPVFQQEAKTEKTKSKTGSKLSIELTPAHQKKIENKLQDLKLTLQNLERRNARFDERKSSLTQAITLTEKLVTPDAKDAKHTALFESWKALHLRELNQQLKKYDDLEFHQMQIRKLQLQTEIEYWKKLRKK